MKRILMILFAFICAASSYSGVTLHVVTSLKGPTHPLYLDFSRPQYDTIRTVTEYAPYFASPIPTSYDNIIRRSEDGLRDTIDTDRSGLRGMPVFISTYNEKGQEVRYEGPVDVWYEKQFGIMPVYYDYIYEYDSEGRMSHIALWVRNSPRSNGTVTDSLLDETFYDYSTLQYTENGYIYDGYEYEMDEQGRVTHIKNLMNPDEYREFSDGKLYRLGDTYYTYSDREVTVFSYTLVSKNVMGAPDRWIRAHYYWSEDGTRFFSDEHSLDDGVNWTATGKSITYYLYAVHNNSDETINETVSESTANACGVWGAVAVNTRDKAQVSVYNATGQIVKQQQVNAGITQISVPKGLYFVTVNNISYKVIVR